MNTIKRQPYLVSAIFEQDEALIFETETLLQFGAKDSGETSANEAEQIAAAEKDLKEFPFLSRAYVAITLTTDEAVEFVGRHLSQINLRPIKIDVVDLEGKRIESHYIPKDACLKESRTLAPLDPLIMLMDTAAETVSELSKFYRGVFCESNEN